MSYIIGIDIGGSTTKIVGMKNGVLASPIRVKAGDPVTSAYGAFGKFLSQNNMELSQVTKVMCTGVGSSFIKNGIYGIETVKVDEFRAIGLGGRYISGKDNAIVVSMGTGTAFISVNGKEISHVCGTGVGGGTILGLSKTMLGISSFEHIVELARSGDITNIDLSIGDISNVGISNMKPHTTASNFGKMNDMATPSDQALGIINLVFQTIGIFAMMAAKAQGTQDIVLTGNLSRIDLARKIMDDLEELYNVRFIIPDNSDFATAIGAAIYGE